MVCILGAEAGHNHAAIVCHAVTVRIFQVEQFGALADINPVVAGLDTGWDQQVIGEDR